MEWGYVRRKNGYGLREGDSVDAVSIRCQSSSHVQSPLDLLLGDAARVWSNLVEFSSNDAAELLLSA